MITIVELVDMKVLFFVSYPFFPSPCLLSFRGDPGPIGNAGVRVLQLQLGERQNEPQWNRALYRRERQAQTLLLHVEEQLGNHRARQTGLLARRRQLLRQVQALNMNLINRSVSRYIMNNQCRLNRKPKD